MQTWRLSSNKFVVGILGHYVKVAVVYVILLAGTQLIHDGQTFLQLCSSHI